MTTSRQAEPGPFDLTGEIGTSIAAKGNALDRTLPRDPVAAEEIARDEYRLYLEAEQQQNRRLHKGHPLHNLGVILVHTGRFAEARTYFHAAHAEDARSVDPDDTAYPWLARQMLFELYGERLAVIEKLGETARASTDEDPLGLARRFEATHGPFQSYRGIRRGWRDESTLDGLETERLVFCAGSHSLDHHLKAIAEGVREAGLEPVIVQEFKNPAGYNSADLDEQDRMDYEKSERLLARCGSVVMDMSDPMGQTIELEKAKTATVPMFIGFASNDPLGRMHGSSMYRGAAVVAGVKPRGFRDTDELRAEVRDWCIATASPVDFSSIPPIGPFPTSPPVLQGSNLISAKGSAMPSAMAGPLDFEPHEIIPSGSYAAPDPDMFTVDDTEDDIDDDQDP